MHALLLPLLALPLSFAAVTYCPCGYTSTSTGAYYTSAILTDFSTFADTSDPSSDPSFGANWTITTDTLAADAPELARAFNASNVWIEGGTLVLRQVGYTGGDAVSSAEVATVQKNISFGSFRSSFRVDQPAAADGAGGVAGFFWYSDDTDEIDVEILTKEASLNASSSIVHYTDQPSWTTPSPLPFPWSTFQTYRFDYADGEVSWYQATSASPAASSTTDVPPGGTGAGIELNMYSNNGSWSGVPSASDVLLYVQYVELYFNTTASQGGGDQAFNEACQAAGGVGSATVCTIREAGEIVCGNS